MLTPRPNAHSVHLVICHQCGADVTLRAGDWAHCSLCGCAWAVAR